MSDPLGGQPDRTAEILIVEDDPGVRVLLARTLKENGFNVTAVPAAPEMWRALQAGHFDMVLLDLMLPGSNGLDICRTIRKTSAIPIIMVTARGEEMDRVLGLELGADDYISKPFSPKELMARMRAVLRRGMGAVELGSPRETVSFAGWTVDLRRRAVQSPEGAEIELSGAEYDLLLSFLDNPQRVLGRERLLELSRTRLGDSSDRSVDVLVSRLRRKLSDGGGAAELIRTVRGVGYMFVQKVERG
jgi:two-component system OmpR family response regulator